MQLLIPVWGKNYIATFADIGLRSLLSENNIPRIANDFEVEISFLTNKEGAEILETQYAASLKQRYLVSYVFIDDLVSRHNYGVTLTLAYARAIMATREAQTKTAFIFFNSDFVVSDGSLATVARLLKEGNRCVIAPSLRVNSEDVIPSLLKRINRLAHKEAFDGRSLVELALNNLHPTVVARTLTQELASCTEYGQFYWRVDDHTLIGAHHLIFHIAIWPEAPLGVVNSYHDYCFVPELAPSRKFVLIDDSDDFLMLELQKRLQESEMVRPGRARFDEIRSGLSSWTSEEHRRFALIPVTFHSKDITPKAAPARASAVDFVTRLHKQMIHPPVGYADHYFWRAGMSAWIWNRKRELGDAFLMPPELGDRYERELSTTDQLAYRELLTPRSDDEIHDRDAAKARFFIQERLLDERGLCAELYSGYANLDAGYRSIYEMPPKDGENADKWIEALENRLLQFTLPNAVQPLAIRGLEFAEQILGVGWGSTELCGMQAFRWFAPHRQPHLFVRVPDLHPHRLHTYIYTCPPEHLDKLAVQVNGRSDLAQGLTYESDRYFLWCDVPADVVRQRQGLLHIIYDVPRDAGPLQIAFRQLVPCPISSWEWISSRTKAYSKSLLGRFRSHRDVSRELGSTAARV
jgi:hypothetical protein